MICHYCGVPLSTPDSPGPEGSQPRTWDHIVPRARGGVDEKFNRVESCRACNGAKSDNFPTCKCAKCTRARRRHWERYRIRDPLGDRHKRSKLTRKLVD